MSQFLSILRNNFVAFIAFLMIIPVAGFSQDEHAADEKKFDASAIILHHVMDDHIWHLWDHGGTIYLPVIVYSAERGLDVFSSRNFYDEHHNVVEYNGYKLDHNHITLTSSGKTPLDVSITKNVAMLFINAALLLLVFLTVAKSYKKNPNRAPGGIQSFFEPIIVFVRDEIVNP